MENFGLLTALLFASSGVGCVSLGEKMGGSEAVAILPFKDHISDDPKDSKNTGAMCPRPMAKQLLDETGINAVVHDPPGRDPRAAHRPTSPANGPATQSR